MLMISLVDSDHIGEAHGWDADGASSGDATRIKGTPASPNPPNRMIYMVLQVMMNVPVVENVTIVVHLNRRPPHSWQSPYFAQILCLILPSVF